MSYKKVTPQLTQIKTGQRGRYLPDQNKFVIDGFGGNFIPGTSGGVSAKAGYVTTTSGVMTFHSLTDNTTSTVDKLYITNTGVSEPQYAGSATQTKYYKCASVNTSNNTWSGYKAVQNSTTGAWSFQSTLTTDALTYTNITPVVNGIYNTSCTLKLSGLYPGGHQLAYLQSTGTQYINTGIPLQFGQKVYIMSDGTLVLGYVHNNDISGTWICLELTNSSGTVYYGSFQNRSSITTSLSSSSVLTWDLANGVYVDGTQQLSFYTRYGDDNIHSLNTPFYLFAIFDYYDNSISRESIKLYSIKRVFGNTILQDFVPYMDKDNVPCMLDRVTNTCYYNQGTGTFQYGQIE